MHDPSLAPSAMLRETGEAAAVVGRLLKENAAVFADLGRRIAARRAPVVTTAARGSSDHAATYFKYLFEIRCGLPVASIGPSVASVYGAKLRLDGGVHLTVSQSGASPDIVALQAAAKAAGALTVAFVNITASPLAGEADIVVPLLTGEEKSVAATKSFIASCAALAALTAEVSGDSAMAAGLHALPESLAGKQQDASSIADLLAGTASFYAAGRGPGFAIALEAALKAKETAGLHAEAFSLAELMHGPLGLAGRDLPVVAFVPDDEARQGNDAALRRLAEVGSPIVRVTSDPASDGTSVAVRPTGSGLIDPIAMIAAYYELIEKVARLRGRDPDAPPNLRKVTETV